MKTFSSFSSFSSISSFGLCCASAALLVSCAEEGPGDTGGPREGEGEGGEAPVAFSTNVAARTAADREVLINVSAFDADEDALSLVVVTPPLRGVATPEAPAEAGASPALRYAPAAGFAGRDTFTVRVSDGALESAELVDVVIDVTGRSCAHVLNSGGSVGDGVYIVDLTPEDEIDDENEVFCDMSTSGGGFMLALKVAGDAQTFCFDDAIWTNDTLLNETSADETPVQAKLAPYLLAPVGELLVVMDEIVNVDAPATRLVVPLSPEAASLYLPLRELIALDATHDSALAASDWQPSLFPQMGVGSIEGVEGINVMRSASSAARIGRLGADDSSIGIGMRSDTCAAGGVDGVTAGARLPGAVGVPVDARVSVRSRDFSFLPARLACEDHAAAGAFLKGTYLLDSDGAGGLLPQPTVCPFDDMRRVVGFARDGVAPDDACPEGFVDDAAGCLAADDVVSLVVSSPIPFTRIKGRIEAAARGDLEGFSVGVDASLDNTYVDGISITVDEPRRHVFTMAVGTVAAPGTAGQPEGAGACPCGLGAAAPAYVGTALLCEERTPSTAGGSAGGAAEFDVDNMLFDDDARNAACNQGFVPNEFDIVLPHASTGPVEVRVMVDGDDANEAIALQRLEIYVQ